MAEPGRPRALDDAKRREICALTTAGFDLAAAAQYVGCSRRTIEREIKRNEEFAERYRRAILACELEPLHSIRQCARSNWRAAAWYLERINPHRFVRRNPVLISPQDIQEFMDSLAQIVMEEVRSEATRKRILRKLMQLTGEIEAAKNEHENTQPQNRPMRLKPKKTG
jgi:hypothetical protein